VKGNLLTNIMLVSIASHSQCAGEPFLNKYRRIAGQGTPERVYFCPILKDLAKTNFKIWQRLKRAVILIGSILDSSYFPPS